MANAASLTNFSSPSLDVGDWLYSIYPRSAPGYLPLNSDTVIYLASSYPTLFGLLSGNNKVIATQTLVNLAGTNYARGTTYGNSTYVMASNTTTCRTSPDGTTWTEQTGFPAGQNIAFIGGYFVNLNTWVYYSTNGVSWTNNGQRLDTIAGIGGAQIATNGTINVIVGPLSTGGATTNYVTSSTVTGTMTARSTLPSNNWQGVVYGNGVFVANAVVSTTLSERQLIATSTDGLTWTSRSITVPQFCYPKMIFANGMFMYIPYNSSGVYYTSTDAITWTARNLNVSGTGSIQIYDLAFGSGVWMGVSDSAFYTSADGINWRYWVSTIGLTYGNYSSIGYGPSGFILAANGNITTAGKVVAPISTTQFTLPVVTALTNTFTYVKAT